MGKKRLIFQQQKSDTNSQKTPLLSDHDTNSNSNFQTPNQNNSPIPNSTSSIKRPLNFKKWNQNNLYTNQYKENDIQCNQPQNDLIYDNSSNQINQHNNNTNKFNNNNQTIKSNKNLYLNKKPSHQTVEGQFDYLNSQSHQLQSYNRVMRSDFDSCKQDLILLKIQRKDQWKYMQNTFYLVIALNAVISVLYIANVCLYFWYFFDLHEDFDEGDVLSKISVSFLYVYIYSGQEAYAEFYGTSSFGKAKKYCELIIDKNDMENCKMLLSDFQILGITSFCCVIIGIILSFIHNKRMYNLANGNDVGVKGRYIFVINCILFSEPPLSYLLYIWINHNKFDFSNSNFGWCFYSCTGIMVLYTIVMIYYKLVKRKQQENEIIDKLLFQRQSSMEQQIQQI